MQELVKAVNRVEKILKHRGLTKKTAIECTKVLDSLENPRFAPFKAKFKRWLDETIALLPDHSKILCSSDIIESLFGAYKNFVSHNKMAGVTRLVLVMAALTCELTQESIKECMENSTVNNTKEWAAENIGETLYQRRRKMKPAA